MKQVHVHTFHKSGSMFLYRYFKYLSEEYKLSFSSINNNPKNITYKGALIHITCPHRSGPREYNPLSFYVIHIRHPYDVLISEYYYFILYEREKGWLNSRPHLRNLDINSYCIKRFKTLHKKYNNLKGWLDKHYKQKNVFISSYKIFYEDFQNWNKAIHQFLQLNGSVAKVYNNFYKEFRNSKNVYKKNTNKSKRRSGLSGQYYVELTKQTLNTLDEINKFRIEKYLKK